jgi:ribonuclease HI
MPENPHALYVNCDGAMNYGRGNPGGVGYIIRFPEALGIPEINESLGTYMHANIERIEMEALIQAMTHVVKIFESGPYDLRNIQQIIFVTDRFGLSDSKKTSPYLVQSWRSNGWYNHENKPIKNHELINKLDKLRKKLSGIAKARIQIEFKSRKQNKGADKLAKAAKTGNPLINSLMKKSEKIGRRLFNGDEMKYKSLSVKQEIHINIFRKDPVQNEWEVWAEICSGDFHGRKFKIYVDDLLAEKLQRGNQYIITLKEVHRFHVTPYKKIKKVKKVKVENAVEEPPANNPETIVGVI